MFLIFWWFNAAVTAYWKHLLSLFLEFIVAFLFFNHLGESIHDPPLFRLMLWNLWYNKSTLSETNALYFIDSSRPFRYFCNKDSNSSLMISSVSSRNKTSVLYLLLCRIRVSSECLEEKKLILIVRLTFHSPWVVWLTIKLFKYGLILFR